MSTPLRSYNNFMFTFQMSCYHWCVQLILLLSGDIKTNPGPISSNLQTLSISHWNLNSITTDNVVKIPLLQAYLTTHKFDILCLSETYLDSLF